MRRLLQSVEVKGSVQRAQEGPKRARGDIDGFTNGFRDAFGRNCSVDVFQKLRGVIDGEKGDI